MISVAAKVTAVLFALSSPTAEPTPYAAFFTAAGAKTCEAVAAKLNAQATKPTDPRFYCES